VEAVGPCEGRVLPYTLQLLLGGRLKAEDLHIIIDVEGHFESRGLTPCSCYWGPFESRILTHCCYREALWKHGTYTLQLLLGQLWKQSTYTLQLLLGALLKAEYLHIAVTVWHFKSRVLTQLQWLLDASLKARYVQLGALFKAKYLHITMAVGAPLKAE